MYVGVHVGEALVETGERWEEAGVEDDGVAGGVEKPRDGLELVEVGQAVGQRLGEACHVCLLLEQALTRLLQAAAALRHRLVAVLYRAHVAQAAIHLGHNPVTLRYVPMQVRQIRTGRRDMAGGKARARHGQNRRGQK
jgi:hypothetical protein